MLSTTRKSVLLLSSVAFLAGLAACESSGGERFSSVNQAGAPGPQGEPGPVGAQGVQGRSGPTGPVGEAGDEGQSGTTLGRAGVLATGGLVGPDGLLGTGLLASTGDPNSTAPVASGVIVQGGDQAAAAAGQFGPTAGQLDDSAPGEFSLATASVQTVGAAGAALSAAGGGDGYLVDGLTAAPGALVSLTGGEAQMLGSAGQSPLVGVSLFSSGQTGGEAATIGLGSGGEPVTLQSAALGDTDLLGGVGDLGDLGGLTDGLGDLSDLGGLTDGLGGVTDITDGLGLDGLADPTQVTDDLGLGGITGGLLGGLGG